MRPSKPISAIIEAFLTGPYSEPRMTQENQTLASAMDPIQPATPRWSKPNPALLASLLAIALAGTALVYELKSTRALRQSLADTQKALTSFQLTQQETKAQLQKIDAKQALSDARQAEVQQQQTALASMYESLTRAESSRILIELEQMLVFASQQLQLTGHTAPAIAALSLVEQRIANLNRPEFITLRRTLQKELGELKTFPELDLTGASSRLDTLVDATDRLPLVIETQRSKPVPRVASESDRLSRIARDVWHDLKQLIQIRRMDKPDAILLAPEQAFFLRENIKLRLLNARAALLGRDDKVFHSELKAVHHYLDRHFDQQSATVMQARDTLRQLEALQINPQLPDLAASLGAIRQTRQHTERIKP